MKYTALHSSSIDIFLLSFEVVGLPLPGLSSCGFMGQNYLRNWFIIQWKITLLSLINVILN